jgi:hypothetical protein
MVYGGRFPCVPVPVVGKDAGLGDLPISLIILVLLAEKKKS